MSVPALDCKSCRYWKRYPPPKTVSGAQQFPDDYYKEGVCKRHAPSVYTGPEGPGNPYIGTAIQPSTPEDDFCGDWEHRSEAPAS